MLSSQTKEKVTMVSVQTISRARGEQEVDDCLQSANRSLCRQTLYCLLKTNIPFLDNQRKLLTLKSASLGPQKSLFLLRCITVTHIVRWTKISKINIFERIKYDRFLSLPQKSWTRQGRSCPGFFREITTGWARAVAASQSRLRCMWRYRIVLSG